jgi:predicted ATPase
MELLERAEYLANLAAWFNGVTDRGGCIALVRGEAGVGKTVLLQEFSRQQQKVHILWGACDALFTPRPLAPLHDIARQQQGALLAAVNSHANREEIFSAVLDELERAKRVCLKICGRTRHRLIFSRIWVDVFTARTRCSRHLS